MNKFTLNADNYFSNEADKNFMSVSLYKSFNICEAATMARLNGEYEQPTSNAFLFGSLVHAHFDGTAEKFKAEHPEMFKRDGDMKAEFARAADCIAAIERQPLLKKYMSGEHEVIKTGEIFDIPWKCKIDSLYVGKAAVDLKTVRDWEPIFVVGQGRRPFYEAYGYLLQGTIYSKLADDVNFYIVAVTKQDPPDTALLAVPEYRLETEMAIVEQRLGTIVPVWRGEREPVRCEKCSYCRQTRNITEIMDVDYFDEFYGEQK